jgi:signal transduction histidine kinase
MEDNNKLRFKIGSGLKNILGRDLITDDFIAIFELVKNSYDAHATKVIIEFENLNNQNASIKISDNGKGMNYDDLLNKWLFVAYSAKNDGSEDDDYRNKIQNNRIYAGAKGIGRFSCDKIGANLELVTRKNEANSKTEILIIDWNDFERSLKEEFGNVDLNHNTTTQNLLKFKSGTELLITDLRERSSWNIEKLLKLKNSLSKLISPFSNDQDKKFEIEIVANDFIEYDSETTNSHKRINGIIENNLFQILKEKTIIIKSEISDDGKKIKTEISDNGEWLFTVHEENKDFLHLHNINIELYYLNRSAKNNFTRTMGIRNIEYGSVFLYKNGIRVYPYGEPGEDPFDLDLRQQKRLGDRLGTQQIIGSIEILGKNEDLKETTSRDGGLIKNKSYFQLSNFFLDTIQKLEYFWISIYKYGINTKNFLYKENFETELIQSLMRFSGGFENIEYNNDLISILTGSLEDNDNAISLISSIEEIARITNNDELNLKIKKVKDTLEEALIIADLAENELKEKSKKLVEKESENLFLKSLKSQEFDEIVSFIHHIGISSSILDNYLTGIYSDLENDVLNIEEIKNIFKILIFENKKILNITRFATKANFKLTTEKIELDLVGYLKEYLMNVIIISNEKGIKIHFIDSVKKPLYIKFRPIEFNVLIDNFLSNSKKANAKNFNLEIKLTQSQNIQIIISDDGIGIPHENLSNIFNFGFTTLGGSGIGLYHIKEIVERQGGKIKVESELNKGTKFKIDLNEKAKSTMG